MENWGWAVSHFNCRPARWRHWRVFPVVLNATIRELQRNICENENNTLPYILFFYYSSSAWPSWSPLCGCWQIPHSCCRWHNPTITIIKMLNCAVVIEVDSDQNRNFSNIPLAIWQNLHLVPSYNVLLLKMN